MLLPLPLKESECEEDKEEKEEKEEKKGWFSMVFDGCPQLVE